MRIVPAQGLRQPSEGAIFAARSIRVLATALDLVNLEELERHAASEPHRQVRKNLFLLLSNARAFRDSAYRCGDFEDAG